MTGLVGELAEYQRQFSANRHEALHICASLSNERFNLRPAPNAWSAGECLAHLNVSERAYIDRIAFAIKQGRQRGLVETGPHRYGVLVRWMIRTMEPPPRRRFKSPRRFTDTSAALKKDKVLADFTSMGEEWNACLLSAKGLHLARVKVRSPAVPLLRFSLGALFEMMAAHERRHLWQAKQALNRGELT